MPIIPLSVFETKRSCQECDACCYVLEVKELNKKQYTNCEHKKEGGGCNIWGKPSRPDVCHSWNCAWLFSWLPEECRPDKSGIVFYPVAAHLTDAKIAHIAGQEVWEGAADSELGKKAFNYLSIKILTVLRHFASEKFSIGGPAGQVKKWKENIAEEGNLISQL